ncbi:Disease resistance protein [Corchorus olitorius]|uniref:Disease resistance protein n=1 Tax=Corchorus olitorius TaxID=93759 RepID=A0A1R3KBN2_9ROSI|nr:Disease resistance protein [Corchorus olitorius]
MMLPCLLFKGNKTLTLTQDGMENELGETSRKNQIADDRVSEDLQSAENEAKVPVNRRRFQFRRKIAPKISNFLMVPLPAVYHLYPRVLYFEKAVEDLRRQTESLELAREKLQCFLNVAKRQNEEVADAVESWLTEADNALDDVQMLENEIKEDKRAFFNRSPDWRWRYRLSKQVAKRMRSVTGAASKFEQVSHLATLKGMEFFLSEDVILFDTPLSALNQIKDALMDDKVEVIELYGTGGVGKTALAKEVERLAKTVWLFDKVVMVYVSQEPDIERIQDQIAESLEIIFDDQIAEDKQDALYSRLCNDTSVLIILDDVWTELPLLEVGIAGCGCKMIYTTRRKQVCYTSNHSLMVQLDALTDAEAWDLFRITAGLSHSSPDFNEVAVEIVKKCNGLPIAIQVAAKALRGKALEEWKAASGKFKGKTLEEWKLLSQSLERSASSDIFEEVDHGFGQLQLSYDSSRNKTTKLCFLLCSLFPEDYKIDMEDLVSCAIEMEFYGDIDKVEDGRNELYCDIRLLKYSSLLSDSGERHITRKKIISDATLLKASQEENFMIRSEVGLEELPKNESFELYTAISMMSTRIKELHEGFVSEKLEILFLGGDGSMTISSTSTFFEGLKALKVFILTDAFLSLHALQNLMNLRSLRLKHCKLHDISSIEKLKKLEILSFHGSDIRELPNEIGELDRLRVLDLSSCQELQKIQPYVIQKLSILEELYIGGRFEDWELAETTAENRNASLSELASLQHLCGLSLKLHSVHLPKDFLFPKLRSYQIAVNEDGWCEYDGYPDPRSLKVSRFSLDAFKELCSNVKDLHLNYVRGYKDLLPFLHQGDRVRFLSLSLKCCQDMECIFDATEQPELSNFHYYVQGLVIEEMADLKELCKGIHGSNFFRIKEKLTVTKCNSLKFAVTWTQVDRFDLQEVRVKECDQLEVVFENIDEPPDPGNEMERFSALTYLELVKLPRLRCIENPQNVHLPSLKVVEVKDCAELISLFSSPLIQSPLQLETLRIHSCYALKQIFPEMEDNSHLRLCLQRLKTLVITDCPALENVLPNTAGGGFLQLSEPDIIDSPQPKQISFQSDNVEENKTMLPQLRQLVLRGLKNLRSFCAEMYVPLPSLEELIVEECPQLTPFIIPFPLRYSKQVHIKELWLSKVGKSSQSPELKESSSYFEYIRVGNLEEIFQVGGGYFFSKLEKLVLEDLSELKYVWKDPTQILTLQNLAHFELVNCQGLRNIFSLVLARNLPQLSHLKIQGCDNLEQIIAQDRIPSSSKVHSGDIYFPNLVTIYVEKCNKLKTLFPVCVAGLPKLEELKVKEASLLKQIFAHEGEAKKEMVLKYEKEVVLPRLKILHLEDLPSLLSFIPMGYHFKFPSLVSLTVHDCPEIVTSFARDSKKIVHAKTEELPLEEENTWNFMAPTGRKKLSQDRN